MKRLSKPNAIEVALHTLAVFLIFTYLSGYQAWVFLRGYFGTAANLIPVIVFISFLILGYAILRLWRDNFFGKISILHVLVGIGLGVLCLSLPDAAFPGKRIHIPQYMLLAFVVGLAFRFRLDGLQLFFCTFAYVAILGTHDEMIQGLHPSRYFSLFDILVNALSGLAGTFIVYGISPKPSAENRRISGVERAKTNIGLLSLPSALLFVIAASGLAMAESLHQLKGLQIETAITLPLLVSTGLWLILKLERAHPPEVRSSISLIVIASFMLVTYPLASNVLQIRFN